MTYYNQLDVPVRVKCLGCTVPADTWAELPQSVWIDRVPSRESLFENIETPVGWGCFWAGSPEADAIQAVFNVRLVPITRGMVCPACVKRIANHMNTPCTKGKA